MKSVTFCQYVNHVNDLTKIKLIECWCSMLLSALLPYCGSQVLLVDEAEMPGENLTDQ